MATFFDVDAVSEMNFLVSRIKVASADITNFELLEAIASCDKPLIISTGASSVEEISSAVRFCAEKGAKDMTLMHCVLNYPTLHENANLSRISILKSHFPGLNIGYSDHTVPEDSYSIQLISWLLGATILEKHFTLDKKLPGNDHYHAFDQEDVKNYFAKLSLWEKSLNKNVSEQQLLDLQNSAREQARRGLFFKRNLKKGDLIQKQDLISLRPVIGIPANEFFLVLGNRVSCDVKQGSPVYKEILE
jgi:N-acetylneuraminate synthase